MIPYTTFATHAAEATIKEILDHYEKERGIRVLTVAGKCFDASDVSSLVDLAGDYKDQHCHVIVFANPCSFTEKRELDALNRIGARFSGRVIVAWLASSEEDINHEDLLRPHGQFYTDIVAALPPNSAAIMELLFAPRSYLAGVGRGTRHGHVTVGSTKSIDWRRIDDLIVQFYFSAYQAKQLRMNDLRFWNELMYKFQERKPGRKVMKS